MSKKWDPLIDRKRMIDMEILKSSRHQKTIDRFAVNPG